jgi:hypothetical protein
MAITTPTIFKALLKRSANGAVAKHITNEPGTFLVRYLVRSVIRGLGELDEVADFIGEPGRTRTCNQTVMSGSGYSNMPINTDVFGEFSNVCTRPIPFNRWPIGGQR